MGIEMNYGSSVFSLPKLNLLDKLPTAGENDVKVLLLIASDEELRASYPESAERISKILNCTVRDVDVSVSFWRGAGVLSADKISIKRETKVKPLIDNAIPEYSGEEVQGIMEKDGGSLAALIEECQGMLEKLFNPVEVNKIVALSDYLKLENEHILMLCAYCKNKGKGSVHYIEKTAFSLYNEGIDSLQKFEEYMKAEEHFAEMETKIRSLFGMGDRSMTASEKSHIRQWTGEWAQSFEMIEKAYEITVENTGKMSIKYLHKILSNWHEEGYRCLEEVEEALEKYKKGKEQSAGVGSFDTDEFFEAALRRSYENME